MVATQVCLEPAPQDNPGMRPAGSESRTASPQIDFSLLVARIRNGEDHAMYELYKVLCRGIRYYLCRQLGPQDIDDKVHDTFMIVVNAIRRGDLREPERLMGFVRTVARHQVFSYIEKNVQSRRDEISLETAGLFVEDRKPTPEEEAVLRQRAEVMKATLAQLSQRDREILERFYLREETQEQICREMRLTETQFRLTKSRAKAKFGNFGKQHLANNLGSLLSLKAVPDDHR